MATTRVGMTLFDSSSEEEGRVFIWNPPKTRSGSVYTLTFIDQGGSLGSLQSLTLLGRERLL